MISAAALAEVHGGRLAPAGGHGGAAHGELPVPSCAAFPGAGDVSGPAAEHRRRRPDPDPGISGGQAICGISRLQEREFGFYATRIADLKKAILDGYKMDGKETQQIPAQISGFEKTEPVYTRLPGWRTSTFGVNCYDQLPQQAKDYLNFFISPENNQAFNEMLGQGTTNRKAKSSGLLRR